VLDPALAPWLLSCFVAGRAVQGRTFQWLQLFDKSILKRKGWRLASSLLSVHGDSAVAVPSLGTVSRDRTSSYPQAITEELCP